MTFQDWIDEKTPKTLGVVLKKDEGTIRVWRHRNVVPRNVWPEIIEAWRTLGTSLSDLLDMEATKK